MWDFAGIIAKTPGERVLIDRDTAFQLALQLNIRRIAATLAVVSGFSPLPACFDDT